MQTDAQYKRNQRLRDKLLLEEIGFNSLEGVMSAIRKLDTNGLKNLQTILCGRNDQAIEAINKARQKTRRTRQAEVNQALRRG